MRYGNESIRGTPLLNVHYFHTLNKLCLACLAKLIFTSISLYSILSKERERNFASVGKLRFLDLYEENGSDSDRTFQIVSIVGREGKKGKTSVMSIRPFNS